LEAFFNKKFREKLKNGKASYDKSRKPYIRKICDISEIGVWLVDGAYVRKNICEDFVNYDHHYHLEIIPKNEFWIAKEASSDETDYYVYRMFVEYRLMEKGVSYEKANRSAAVVEGIERGKSEIMKKLGKRKEHKKEMTKAVHKELLETRGKLKVWLVNGELVRDLLYIDFGGGGHDKVYHFIPENEVWLDDDMDAKERKFILLHELHERALMAKGMDYPHAHNRATEAEDFFRHNPKWLSNAINRELKKQG
jgi:hypothetical protein